MAEKLLQEVMEEIKMTEKQLTKDADIFAKYSVITEFEKPSIGKDDNDRNAKFSRDTAASVMQSKYQSYMDRCYRLAQLKKARDIANMQTTINLESNGHKLSIYDAILLKRSIATHINRAYRAIEDCKERAEGSNKSYVNNSIGGGRKGNVSSEVETYPLLPLTAIEKQATDFTELLSQIDAQISIANAIAKVNIE